MAKVATNDVTIWDLSSIPTIQSRLVIKRADCLIELYLTLLKSSESDAEHPKFKAKLQYFKSGLNVIRY